MDRKEDQELKIDFKFDKVKKDVNSGIGFDNPYRMINQNSLGHSQN